jgi:hypothetical protein
MIVVLCQIQCYLFRTRTPEEFSLSGFDEGAWADLGLLYVGELDNWQCLVLLTTNQKWVTTIKYITGS